MVKITYEQLTNEQMLKVCCDWLMEQQNNENFFNVFELGKQRYEWYMIMYSVRTLILGGKLLNEDKYIEAALKYTDLYISEQLPNGGFTSNYRKTPSSKLDKKGLHEILRFGRVNLADNGSNVLAVLQAVPYVDINKQAVYLNAARRWFDEWVAIWSLPEGGYGNGIWVGHKLNSPYSVAMSMVAAAFSAFSKLTGEYEYVENAERCMTFHCSKWTDEDDGRPIYFDCYPLPSEKTLSDFGHSFYLLEGMCWTHFASNNADVKSILEDRLKMFIFGPKGLLSQWGDSWFNFMVKATAADDTRFKLRLGWEMAKSNGIMHCFLYYLNHIEDNEILREKVNLGLKYLTHPLKSRMSGVMSDPEESYGAFAVQSTGFAGLSLAEAIKADSVFSLSLPSINTN